MRRQRVRHLEEAAHPELAILAILMQEFTSGSLAQRSLLSPIMPHIAAREEVGE